MQIYKLGINYDKWGIVTAVACAVHCTLLPVLASVMPFLGVESLEHPVFEWGFIAIAVLFGSMSMWHGYRHHHKKLLPFAGFVLGLTLLIVNQLTEEAYLFYVIPVAAAAMIAAHLFNIIYCKKYPVCKGS